VEFRICCCASRPGCSSLRGSVATTIDGSAIIAGCVGGDVYCIGLAEPTSTGAADLSVSLKDMTFGEIPHGDTYNASCNGEASIPADINTLDLRVKLQVSDKTARRAILSSRVPRIEAMAHCVLPMCSPLMNNATPEALLTLPQGPLLAKPSGVGG
jgi:hypothetical protein